jgi:predicted DNA binding protein
VPRGATLAEIADELGVSNQAVSQRLRRATNTLVGMQMHRS